MEIEILGYGIQAGREAIGSIVPAVPDKPAAIMKDTSGKPFFAPEEFLLDIIDKLEGQAGSEKSLGAYRQALEGLQEKMKNGYPFGKPLHDANDFVVPEEREASAQPVLNQGLNYGTPSVA